MQNQIGASRNMSFCILAFAFPPAGSSNRRTAPFEGANAGAIPAPATNFRPVVIAIREANVLTWAPDLQGLGSLPFFVGKFVGKFVGV